LAKAYFLARGIGETAFVLERIDKRRPVGG
jgi:hypothetical protein